MNPNEAAKLVVKKYPGRIPTGYWIRGDAVIINTRRLGVSTGMLTALSMTQKTARKRKRSSSMVM